MSAHHTDMGGRGADFDALTDLFLGGEHEGIGETPALRLTDDRAAEAVPMVLEALVLGHLPVRANPWVAQYARSVATERGAPVALLRMGGGQIGIDLYGLEDANRSCQAEKTLEGALSRVASRVSRVIVQVQDTDERTLGRASCVDRVTLLTAANDAAVVSVYRTIKALSADRDELSIAVMGEVSERAKRVIEKLRETSRAFLGVRLEDAGSIEKMGPTGGAMVFLGDCELGFEAVAERIEALRDDPKETAQAEPETRDEPAFASTVFREPVAAPATQNTAVGEGLPRVDRQQATTERAPARTQTRTVELPDARTVALSMLGLKPVAASCPDDEGVAIARGADGSVHVVCEDEHRRGLERLSAVSAWAHKHAKLLAAIDRELCEAAREPVLHLLTEEPRGIRHLLDTNVRVHVLRRAGERCGTGWTFVELN